MAYSLHPLGAVSTLALVIAFVPVIKLIQFIVKQQRSRYHLAVLRGPPNTSFLFGKLREVISPDDTEAVFDRWVNEYGKVFKVPTGLGSNRVMICDPKAIAHVYANDSFGYLRTVPTKFFSETLMGRNMLSSDKEDHRRQRRAAAPAFTNNTLRTITNHFFDVAYKVKAVWDTSFESRAEVIIEIHEWLTKTTLDSIGIAGFGHDFKSIEGQTSAVTEALDALSDNGNTALRRLFVIGILFPPIFKLPLKQIRVFWRMKKAFSDMAAQLLQNAQEAGAKGASENMKDRSILGMLVRGRTSDTNFKLLHEEVVGQIGLFLFAGHDTTASSLSWALLELARHPDKQEKLRKELLSLSGNDPTWDHLTIGTTLPYLDAVVHETLRLHPPVEALDRVADTDDSIPLSSPITTPRGEVINSVFIPKGTMVRTSFVHINRSEEFWGPDARKFSPERWLEENPYPSKDFSGYRHIYTFSDGPRMCIGRMFAVAEMKAILSVFIRHFTFDLPCGPETPIDTYKSFLTRPKLADERDCILKMRVRQLTAE